MTKKTSHEPDINRLRASFKDIWKEEELSSKIIEFFPYPIQVYGPDGTSVMVNKAMMDEFEIADREFIIGRYNIFKDPDIAVSGLVKQVKRAFKGETVYLSDLHVPLKTIKKCYATDSHDVNVMYQDATLFPIYNGAGRTVYVVVILITRRIYKGKESIIKAKEYLKNNWGKEFNIDEVSKAANLSPYHFSRVFKHEEGITPYNYYLNMKIEKIKEKLFDTNLSISEVFAACGVDYHGHFAGYFKKIVGVTPSEYRRKIRNK